MSEEFRWSEFGSSEGEHDPDFHFASLHSPTLKYKHIVRSSQSLDEGLGQFGPEEEEGVQAYSSISIFRDTMEYLEEFGIYLYSLLNPEEGFVDAVTRADTSEIKEILSKVRDGNYGNLIPEDSEFDDIDDFLRRIFGYDLFLDSELNIEDQFEEVELLVGDKEAAVEKSIQTIKQKLERVAWFFLYFDEAYNAIKHGNRVSISQSSTFEIENERGDKHEIEVDEPIAEFLCKATGDTRGGKRYIFSAPVNHLREASVATAKECRDLFKPIYDVSHAFRESERSKIAEQKSLDLSFYGIHESGDDSGMFNFTKLENPDSSIWIPAELVPAELEDTPNEFTHSAFSALKEQSGELVIQSEGDNNPSFAYPIETEGTTFQDKDRVPGWEAELNFKFRESELPLWQYKELLSLKEHEPFNSITLENPEEGISKKERLNQSINAPTVEKPGYWDLLKFAWRAGLAADEAIFYPVFLYEPAAQVLEKYKNKNLTREVAEQCLRKLAVATSDCVYTELKVSIVDPEKRVQDGYKVIDTTVAESVPGVYNFEINEGKIGEISIDENYPEEFNRQDPGYIDMSALFLTEESADEVYETIDSEALQGLKELTEVRDPADAESCIIINREHGVATHWYWFDRLKVNIYLGLPPHAVDNIDQMYHRE